MRLGLMDQRKLQSCLSRRWVFSDVVPVDGYPCEARAAQVVGSEGLRVSSVANRASLDVRESCRQHL